MRVDVHKFLFMGATQDKSAFFVAAQEAGIIEFVQPTSQKKERLPEDIEKLLSAIKILRGYVHEEQDQKKELEKAVQIADTIITLRAKKTTAEQKLLDCEQEIERQEPFGEFSPQEILRLQTEIGQKVRFFCAKTTKHMQEHESSLILVNQKDGIDYFIIISNEPVISTDLQELHFEASLSGLKTEREQFAQALEASDSELKQLTIYDHLLRRALVHHVNLTSLRLAEESSEFELENQLFLVEGWVPTSHLKKLYALCAAKNIHYEKIAIESLDSIPTFLENQGPAKIGEDLVHIFDTPASSDKDPSLWVLITFALFFSMIVYDAGYGLIFLATALVLRFRKKNLTGQAKRFVSLIMLLGAFCTLWGGLTHSIFGIHLAPDNVIRKHSLMTWLIEKKAAYHLERKDDVYQSYVQKYSQIKDTENVSTFLYAHNPSDPHAQYFIADKFRDNVLLELALFLGSIHICIGCWRYLGYNPAGIGWIAFIIGSYLYLPNYLQATSLIHFLFGINPEAGAEFGLHLLLTGLVISTVVGMIKHGIVGILEPMHSIQVFADVLSYLRLYALGYAGFIVSETVVSLSTQLPLFFMVLALIAGHLLNIILAILGGTIHGLRLNFLEWYRYSFYGGGKEFRPLQLTTLE